jgi:carbonic anhydrase
MVDSDIFRFRYFLEAIRRRDVIWISCGDSRSWQVIELAKALLFAAMEKNSKDDFGFLY